MINRNTNLMIIHDFMFEVVMVIGMCNSKAISTSKITKATAIRKNRDEKGSRRSFLGQIHIRMVIFLLGLRCFFFFFEISVVRATMAVDRRIIIVAVVVIVIIMYLVFTNFLIGSQVYFLLY